MSQLRKEYKEYKHIHEQNFREAAEAWTEENVILINERLNRNAIYRLNSAIQRFDNKFGKYRDRLPAISNILDNAENGLHLVITGKVGSRSAAQMLQRMSIMYNILSNFFGGDLGALLKTPAFRVAHQRPDEKIDKIVDQGHNVKEIRRNLAAALKPSEEERTIFRRAYKSFDMPTLDWNMAAKQLCCLSCNELSDLAGIEKVPMVVVDKENVDDTGLDEQGRIAQAWNTTGNVVSRVAAAPVAAVTTAGVAGVQGLMNRFKGPSPKDIADMNKYLKQIQAVLPAGDPAFEAARQGLDRLIANIKKAESGTKVNFDQNWLRNPTAIAISQGKQLIDIFERLGSTWNSIKGKYASPLKPEDIKNIEKTLNQQVNSATSKLGRLFKVNLPKGLTAKDIIKALVDVAKKGSEEAQPAPAAPAGPASVAAPAPGVKAENKQYYGNIFEHVFSSIPESAMLSEGFIIYLEELEMLSEGFEDLDQVLTRFSQIKTTVDDKLEKQTNDGKMVVQSQQKSPAPSAGAGTNIKRPRNAQEVPIIAQNIASEADAAAQQDPNIDATDVTSLDASIATLDKNLSDPLNGELLKNINTQIVALKVPGITDYNTAAKFVKQYITILNSQTLTNVRRAMSMTLNTIEQNLQNQTRPIKENSLVKRKIVVEKIKKIIIEQMAEADVTQITPQSIVKVGNPSTAPTTQTAPAQSPALNVQLVAANETELPVIDDTVIKNYVSKINDLNKYPLPLTKQILAAISNQLKTYNIPGVNDLQTFTNFMTTYQSIMTNAGNIRKILSMINKTAAVFNKPAPAAAPAPAAPATPAR